MYYIYIYAYYIYTHIKYIYIQMCVYFCVCICVWGVGDFPFFHTTEVYLWTTAYLPAETVSLSLSGLGELLAV